MKKRIDYTGTAHGDLSVVEKAREERSPGRVEVFWRCKCACGDEIVLHERSLRLGLRKNCMGKKHPHPNSKDNSGATYGRLTVLGVRRRDDGKPLRLCKCTCGKEKEILLSQLTSGGTLSCGCLASERARARRLAAPKKDRRERAITSVMAGYAFAAKKRKREWSLTRGEVERIIFSDCAYCGGPPTGTVQHVGYRYNGIDRVNNEIGYISGNAVACCAACNRAKRDMTFDEWCEWVDRLTSFRASVGWGREQEKAS